MYSLHAKTCNIIFITIILTCNTAFAQNQRLIDSLSHLLSAGKADTSRARLYIQIGDKYEYNNDSLSIGYYYKAIGLSNKLQYKWGEAVARQYLAEVYTRQNLYDSAMLHLQKVLDLAHSMKDLKRTGVASNSVAIINMRKGDLDLAIQYFLQAAENFEKLDASQRILLISCYTNIGSVFYELGENDKALQYQQQALAIAEEIKNDIEIAYAACEVAIGLQKMGKAKDAKKYIERAVTIANKEDDLYLKMVAWQNLGTAHLQEQNYNDALAAFNQALNFSKQYGDTSRIALMLGYTGETQYRLNNFTAAGDNLMTALRYFNNANDLTGLTKIYESLYNLESTKKNYKKAFEFLELYSQFKDSIYNISKTKSLNALESKYQHEKKVKEIAQLSAQRTEQELVITQRNRWLIISGLSLALLTIFSIFIYKNSRQKMVIARQQQDLQQQQISSLEKQQQVIALQSMINGQEGERTRIARDLHDGLGGIFSTVKMHFSTLQHEVPELKSNNLYRKSFEMVDGASEELRKIAHNMMPEVLMKMGLVPALQDLCNNIGAGKQLHINLQAYGMDKRLSASIEVMLFRIIQELINNIIKHSGASETIIQFNRNANNLNITVEDNGNGFDVNEIETKRQAGLQTIRSRVAFLDGRISIDSKTGVGTTVMIDLLLNEQ